MTLAEKLHPKLSEWRPAGGGRHSLAQSFADEGWSVQLTADKTDALAVLVWELDVARTGDAPAGLTLKAWADRTAARAVGLLESLKVLEVDEGRGEALLRSVTPARKGEQVAYYEVKLFGTGRAEVRRFTADRTASGRTQIGFALTHEVLAKLVGDVTD